MRKLIGRAGPLLIFAPSRVAGSREAEAVAPTLAEKLEQALAGTLGRKRDPAVEDLWDPAGVPGPLEIAIESRARRVAWRLWAGGRR